jgi:hypothetical protein
LRSGPLVRRSANVSRVGHRAPALSRVLPRAFLEQPRTHLSLPPIAPRGELHLGCRLPINLRRFLAQHLGCHAQADDETILSFAAHADQLTLNKLARAIRRYSTLRAREAWAECSVAVAKLADANRHRIPATLCLRCARVAFGDEAACGHQGAGCLAIILERSDAPSAANETSVAAAAQRIQRLVEEFRGLRTAFGLSHFDLDCYLRGEQLTLMWHPLP